MYAKAKMGTVISSKVRDDGKVVFEVCVEEAEALQLAGHLSNIHLFSENNLDITTSMSGRGKNEATKYFLIPKSIRVDLNTRKKVHCQKIETKTKMMFIFVMDRI